MKPKPHTAHNQLVLALQKVQRDNGKLSLSLFKRVKQLGSGDVGLVDLVQLQVAQMRYGRCSPRLCSCWFQLRDGLLCEVYDESTDFTRCRSCSPTW